VASTLAKGLLTGYRDAFGSLDGWGRASFVAEQIREMVFERTAARANESRASIHSRSDSGS
jgi:hypothetical protein